MVRLLSVVVLALVLSACTWVKLSPEGESVRLATPADVGNCARVGSTTVSLVDKVIGIERNREKVQEELNRLARNSAADVKGDTIVPIGAPQDGRQNFDVYRCR